MSDISNSNPTNLPTTKQLIRSTIIAAVIAAVLLVTVVLPAEYGVDPTGIGNVFGLTEMGLIKVSLAKEVELAENEEKAAAATTATPAVVTPAVATGTTATTSPAPADGTSTPRTDVTTVTLAPNEGREVKLVMREGARVTFSWQTNNGVVNFDEHADSTVPRRDYHGYRKGSALASDEGVLTAAFDGSHGWFWRNRGKETLTVTLRTSGEYSEIKEPE